MDEGESVGCALELVLKGGGPWGFSIKGGTESNSFLYISKICQEGLAHAQGQLREGDILIKINDVECYSKWEAVQLIRSAFQTLSLVVWRGPPNHKIRVLNCRVSGVDLGQDKEFQNTPTYENDSVKLRKPTTKPASFSEFNLSQDNSHKDIRNDHRDKQLDHHRKSNSSPHSAQPKVSERGMEKVAFFNFLHFPSHHASHSLSLKKLQGFDTGEYPNCKSKYMRPTSMLETGSSPNGHNGSSGFGLNGSHFVKNSKRSAQPQINRASKRASRTAKLLNLGSSFSFSTSSKCNANPDPKMGHSKFFGLKTSVSNKENDLKNNNGVTGKSYSPSKDIIVSPSEQKMPCKGNNQTCKSGDVSTEFYENPASWRHQVLGSLDMPSDHGYFRMLPEDSFRPFTPIIEVTPSLNSPKHEQSHPSDESIYESVIETRPCENTAIIKCHGEPSLNQTNLPLYQTIKKFETSGKYPQRPPLSNNEALNTARNRSPLSTSYDVAELIFSQSNGTLDTQSANSKVDNAKLERAMEFGNYFNGSPTTKELVSRSNTNLTNLEIGYTTSSLSPTLKTNHSPCKSTVSCLWSPGSASKGSPNHTPFKPAKSDSHLNYVVKTVAAGLGSSDKFSENVFDLPGEGMNGEMEIGEGVRERELEAMTRKYVKASKFYSLQGLRKLGKGSSKTAKTTGGNCLPDGRILESLQEINAKEGNEPKTGLDFTKVMPTKGASMSVASLNSMKTIAYRGGQVENTISRRHNNVGQASAITCSKSMSKIFNAKKRGAFLPSLSSIFKPLTQHHNSPFKSDVDLEADSCLDREVERDLAESVGRFEGNQAKARGRSTWTEKYRKMWLDEEYQRMKTNTQSASNVHDIKISPIAENGCNGSPNAWRRLALLKVLSEHPSDSINKNYPYIRMGIACHKFKSTESVTTSFTKNPDLSHLANPPTGAKSTPLIASGYFDKSGEIGTNVADMNLHKGELIDESGTIAIENFLADDRSNQCQNDHLYENLGIEEKCPAEENSNDTKCFDTILTSLDNILNAQITDKITYSDLKLEEDVSLITQFSESHPGANKSTTTDSLTLNVGIISKELTQTTIGKITLPREDYTSKKHGLPQSPGTELNETLHSVKSPAQALNTSISFDQERCSGVERQRYSSYLQDIASEWDDDNFERIQREAKYFPTNRSKIGPSPPIKSPTSGGTVSFPISKMTTISELKNSLGELTTNTNKLAGSQEPDANLLDLLSGMMRRKQNRHYAQSILCGQGKIFSPDYQLDQSTQPDNDSIYRLEKSKINSIGLDKKKSDPTELDGHERSSKRDSNCALNTTFKKSATLDSSSPSLKTASYYFPHIDVAADKSSPKSHGPELAPKPKINQNTTQTNPSLDRKMLQKPTCESPSPLYVKSYAAKETVGCVGLTRSRYHRYYSNNNNSSNSDDKITTTVSYVKPSSRYVKSTDPTSNKTNPENDTGKGPATPSAPPSRSDSGYCSWDNGYDALPLIPQAIPTPTLAKNMGGSGDETEEMDEESFGYCEDGSSSLLDDFPPGPGADSQGMGRRAKLGESTPSLSTTTTDNNSSIGSFPEHSDHDGGDPIYVNNNGGYAYKYPTSLGGARSPPSQGPNKDYHERDERGEQAYNSPQPPRILPRLRHRPDIIPRITDKTSLSQNGKRQSILLDQSSDSMTSKIDQLTPTHHYHARSKSRGEKDFETLSLEFSKMTTDPRILEVLMDPLSGWMEEAVVKLYALFGLPCYQNTLDTLKQINEKAFVMNGLDSRTSFEVKFVKAELLKGVNCMMDALRDRQMAIEGNIQSDECKWQSVVADLSKVAKPSEVERAKQYFEDLEKIICLLMSLSFRITKTGHKLEFLTSSKMSDATAEKENLIRRSEKLILQFNEAIKLKESIDKRGSNINTYFTNYSPHLDCEFFSIHSKTRAKLIIDKRHVIEKIKLGEEQITALETQQNL